MNKPMVGDLRIFWIPQVPMKAFYVSVENIKEAAKILRILANYDIFQFQNRIKPDYSNAGGLQICEDLGGDTPEWNDWYNENDVDIDSLMDHGEL